MLVESGIGAARGYQPRQDGGAGPGLVRPLPRGHGPRSGQGCVGGLHRREDLGANQIEFVNLIVNHLTEHGVMEAARLYESPFTDLTPRGPDGLFTSAQVDELMAALAAVRETAVAA